MLQGTYRNVAVIFRGPWSRPDDREPIQWRSGKLVERVKVMDPDSGETADFTVAENLNGELAPGQTYDLDVETTIKKNGNRTAFSHRIVSCKVIAPVKAAA